MLGNTEWFRLPGKIPVPKCRWGWMFYFMWFLTIFTPSTIMAFFREQYWESVIWLVISITAFAFDTITLKREIRRQNKLESLFFIGDDDPHVSTKNFDFSMRNPPK
jgi:hypothetical protein